MHLVPKKTRTQIPHRAKVAEPSISFQRQDEVREKEHVQEGADKKEEDYAALDTEAHQCLPGGEYGPEWGRDFESRGLDPGEYAAGEPEKLRRQSSDHLSRA